MKKALPVIILSLLAIAGVGIFVVGKKNKSSQDNAADQAAADAAKAAADAKAEADRLIRDKAKKEQIAAALERAAERAAEAAAKAAEAEAQAIIAAEQKLADKWGMSLLVWRAYKEELAWAKARMRAVGGFSDPVLREKALAYMDGFDPNYMVNKARGQSRRTGLQIYMDSVYLVNTKG